LTKQHNKQSGFTLVELAIVMIIIGLLIGGILKGQELIANAQTTATIAQIKGYDGALSTFRDKYSAFPGDMQSPDTRLPNCDGAVCGAAGDGNGRIDGGVLNVPAAGDESLSTFSHMAAADLISGVAIEGGPVFGGALPEAEMGGGFWVAHEASGEITTNVTDVRRGHYLVLTDTPADITDASAGGISAVQAGQVDRKLDDGDAITGSVRATGEGCRVVDDADPDNTVVYIYILRLCHAEYVCIED